MNKQTKQIIILIVLVVVAGGVAIFWTMGGDDSSGGGGNKPKKEKDNKAAAKPTDTGAKPSPGGAKTPAGGGAQPTVAAQQDLDMPEEGRIPPQHYSWKWQAPRGGEGGNEIVYDPAKGESPPFDPLMVQNIDVIDPTRKLYIETLKAEWILDGIIETVQRVPEVGDDGKPKVGPDGKPVEVVRPVLEAWFKEKRRPFRENDRLTGTRFTIVKIFTRRKTSSDGSASFRVRAGVELLGDTGAKLTLYLADDGRYPVEQK